MFQWISKIVGKIGDFRFPIEPEMTIEEDDDFALVEIGNEEIYLYKSDGILFHSMQKLGVSKQEAINAVVEAQYREDV